MSMFRTFSDAVQATFLTITSTMGSVQKGLDIANDYVDNQHKSLTRGFAKQAIRDTAAQHERIQAELEASPKLAVIFADLEAEWDDPEWHKHCNSRPLLKAKPKKAAK